MSGEEHGTSNAEVEIFVVIFCEGANSKNTPNSVDGHAPVWLFHMVLRRS